MGIVIVLIVIAALGIMAFGIFGAVVMGGMGAAEKKRVDAAPSHFVDAGDTVIITTRGDEREAVIKAADEAGYHLGSSVSGRYDQTLTFRRG